jgi:hypothetical protein
MVSQLTLVVAVVVAGVIIAAVVSLRSLRAQHRGAPASDSPAVPPMSQLPGGPETAAAPAGIVTVPTLQPADAVPMAMTPPAVAATAAATLDPTITIPSMDPTLGGAEAPVPPTLDPASTIVGVSGLTIGSHAHPNSVVALAEEQPPQPIPAPEVFAMLYELALGKTSRGGKVFTRHDHIVVAVEATLHQAATQERYAPRRPNMLPRLLSAANDENYSRRELAALIARDPSLVGSLLKIANSSYYRISTEPVESVDRAVILLGTDGIRSLVTAALMQPIFRVGGKDFPQFPEVAWEHTFRAASAAVPYNFLVEKSDPFAAELLSLVMGLAGIVIFRVATDQYATDQRLRPDAGVITALLDKHSASVARRIGESWELSDVTLEGLEGQTMVNDSYPTPLGRSLYFGRLVGALAVLRMNQIIGDDVAKLSIPATRISESQVDRMWTRLTPKSPKP